MSDEKKKNCPLEKYKLRLVKYKVLKFLRKVVGKFGFQLLSEKQINHFKIYTAGLLRANNNKEAENDLINSIVFSKDRAMQLHAFLSSYVQQVSHRGRMHVLYKCSDERHRRSYADLIKTFSGDGFIFIEEQDFRNQVIQICEQSFEDRIIFYVDDMIFTHSLDYGFLKSIDTSKYVLALSRGRDMDYSIVLKRSLALPNFIRFNEQLLCFKWNEIRGHNDWSFPLGVSGYMYGKPELVAMLKAIPFKAPNSLEDSLQTFLPFFKDRLGLCAEYAVCVCVHANLVQTEGSNHILGTYSIEDLLTCWEEGKRIQLQEFYNKPMNVTQIQKYSFN